MAINFPNAPILNQTFSSGNNTYIWNGSAWVGYSTVTSGGGGVTVSSQWVTAAAGIHTSSNVGIGTTNPTQSLTVNGVIRAGVSTFYTFQSSAGFTGDGSEGRYLQLGYQTNPNYILNNIGIGTTNATSKLTVQGTLSVSGVSTFNDNVVAPSITGNTIVLPGLNIYPITNGIDFFGGGTNFNIRQTLGTGGKFTISRNIGSPNLIAEFSSGGSVDLYYNASKKFETTNTGVTITGTTFTNQLNVSGVSNFNGLVGLGVTNPTSNLHVDGHGRFTGVVTATTFIGDGSGLTNIVATGTGIEIRDDGSVIGTASTINFGSNISVSQINAGIVTVSATPITTLPELSVTGITTTNTLSVSGNSTISGNTSTNNLSVSNNVNVSGIVTASNIGISTTNALTPLQVESIYGVKTGIGTFNASVGIAQTIDSFTISQTDFKTAEYTIHIGFGTYIQSQKVLVMQNGTTAYSQEYAIMYHPELIVSIGATISGNQLRIQATPESGVTGLTTYRFTRQTML